MKKVYPEEKGKLTINGKQMEWKMTRSKGESAFGIRGSRIFQLIVAKDGRITLMYDRGYSVKPENEDEETALCLSHLIERYGKEKRKEK
jgi:hypothetical protein